MSRKGDKGGVTPIDLGGDTVRVAEEDRRAAAARAGRGSHTPVELGEETRAAFAAVGAATPVPSDALLSTPTDPTGGRGARARRADTTVPTILRPRADLVGGRYQLVDKLGEGAMGTVYKGVHRDLGKPFAIKIIRSNVFDVSKGRELFLHEARTASSLTHPNVVSVTDFGIDQHHGPYLVMELLQGETLRVRLDREGRMQPGAALDIIHQLLDALRFVHQREVVHCDLKPDNLFLSVPPGESQRRNHLQILDFGLAAGVTGTMAGSKLPQAGGTAGTPPYMAPERILGGRPTPIADLYSVGAVFYEMVTGRPTHRASGLLELINLIVKSQPPAPDQLGVDPRISALVMRLLERDPARRFATAYEVLQATKTVMSELGFRRTRPPRYSISRSRIAFGAGVFEKFALPLAVASALGRIQVFNPAFSRVVKVPPGELIGRHLAELFPVEAMPEVISQVIAARGVVQAWVKLPEGTRLNIARYDGEGEMELHVSVTKK